MMCLQCPYVYMLNNNSLASLWGKILKAAAVDTENCRRQDMVKNLLHALFELNSLQWSEIQFQLTKPFDATTSTSPDLKTELREIYIGINKDYVMANDYEEHSGHRCWSQCVQIIITKINYKFTMTCDDIDKQILFYRLHGLT